MPGNAKSDGGGNTLLIVVVVVLLLFLLGGGLWWYSGEPTVTVIERDADAWLQAAPATKWKKVPANPLGAWAITPWNQSAPMSLDDCKQRCASHKSCLGVNYHHTPPSPHAESNYYCGMYTSSAPLWKATDRCEGDACAYQYLPRSG